jgi:hypothetical protein
VIKWRPRRSANIQQPAKLQAMPAEVDHPEGICALKQGGKDGLLVLYDTLNPKRRVGSHYRADWMALTSK